MILFLENNEVPHSFKFSHLWMFMDRFWKFQKFNICTYISVVENIFNYKFLLLSVEQGLHLSDMVHGPLLSFLFAHDVQDVVYEP